MSLSQDQLAWIEDQITHDPDLQDRVLASGGPAQAAALIVALAQTQGVTVSEQALRQHFARQESLGDDALDGVSGAGWPQNHFS